MNGMHGRVVKSSDRMILVASRMIARMFPIPRVRSIEPHSHPRHVELLLAKIEDARASSPCQTPNCTRV